jgi:hypothetical protein
MAFPSLEITKHSKCGNGVDTYITMIKGIYTGATYSDESVYLIRDTYTITRNYMKQNTNDNTGVGTPRIPYDTCRIQYNWTGHIDICTDSVTRITPLGISNMNLLEGAIFLRYIGGKSGVKYSYSTPLNANVNSVDLTTNASAEDLGGKWPYKTRKNNKSIYQYVLAEEWLIENFDVTDNLNGSSRLTISLSKLGDAINLQDKLEDIINV